MTPKINEADKVQRKINIDEEMLKEIEKMIREAPKGGIVPTSSMDPLSQLARKR